jgi:hypothetical protein
LPTGDAYTEFKYEKYGFSMQVPAGMQPAEFGKSWQGTASGNSGLVRFGYGSSPYELMGVQWSTVEAYPDPEDALDEFSTAAEALGVDIQQGELFETMIKDGHELIYQPFELMDGQINHTGFVGAWFCDEDKRVYQLYYSAIRELTTREGSLAEFQHYVDDFVCHP